MAARVSVVESGLAPLMFTLALLLVSFLAGAIASVAGFGIGSILTPLLSLHTGTRLAVGAVSIPHFLATLLRFWLLRRDQDTRVLLHFGILSAAGGLAGALLHSVASDPALTLLFAVLLIFARVAILSGCARRMRLRPRMARSPGASARARCSAVFDRVVAAIVLVLGLPILPPAFL